jgi:hypothetical protein
MRAAKVLKIYSATQCQDKKALKLRHKSDRSSEEKSYNLGSPEMNLIWSFIAKRLMESLVIIEPEILC